MSQTTVPVTSPPSPAAHKRALIDSRYVAPLFITSILLVGHLTFGILESYPRTLLAIGTSIAAELA
ncbi:MAG: hypothetical protein J2P13_09910, partial [Acidobacteria bacterium]|nr:hypothetical protein [Acidobacteriota bacterium]